MRGQLKGPRQNWAKWREARDKKLANPSRNQGAQRMHKRRAEKESHDVHG